MYAMRDECAEPARGIASRGCGRPKVCMFSPAVQGGRSHPFRRPAGGLPTGTRSFGLHDEGARECGRAPDFFLALTGIPYAPEVAVSLAAAGSSTAMERKNHSIRLTHLRGGR
jgi:hypothetical protein